MFSFLKKFLNKKEGSLIIEAVVASSLVIVGLLGLFRLMYVSALKSQEAVHRLQAVYLASEGIEVVKNIIDNNLAQNDVFYSGIESNNISVKYDSYLIEEGEGLIYFNNGFFSTDNSLTKTIFSRKISVNKGANDTIFVTSTVSWVENNKSMKVVLSDEFYNWRPNIKNQ